MKQTTLYGKPVTPEEIAKHLNDMTNLVDVYRAVNEAQHKHITAIKAEQKSANRLIAYLATVCMVLSIMGFIQ